MKERPARRDDGGGSSKRLQSCTPRCGSGDRRRVKSKSVQCRDSADSDRRRHARPHEREHGGEGPRGESRETADTVPGRATVSEACAVADEGTSEERSCRAKRQLSATSTQTEHGCRAPCSDKSSNEGGAPARQCTVPSVDEGVDWMTSKVAVSKSTHHTRELWFRSRSPDIVAISPMSERSSVCDGQWRQAKAWKRVNQTPPPPDPLRCGLTVDPAISSPPIAPAAMSD